MAISIRDAKERHAAELMALPGVVAVGIGQGPHGGEVIVVSVRRGDEATASRVPAQLDGHDVVVRYTDEVRAL